jgi:hypothetical protein
MTCFVQMQREGFAVCAGGFHAGMNRGRALLDEPRVQLLKTYRRVREGLVLEFAAFVDETDIELNLAMSMPRTGKIILTP